MDTRANGISRKIIMDGLRPSAQSKPFTILGNQVAQINVLAYDTNARQVLRLYRLVYSDDRIGPFRGELLPKCAPLLVPQLSQDGDGTHLAMPLLPDVNLLTQSEYSRPGTFIFKLEDASPPEVCHECGIGHKHDNTKWCPELDYSLKAPTVEVMILPFCNRTEALDMAALQSGIGLGGGISDILPGEGIDVETVQ